MRSYMTSFAFALAITCPACGGAAEQAAASPTGQPVQQATAPPPSPAATAPDPSPADRGPIVARVNGTPIYKADVESAMASFMKSNGVGPDVPEEKKREIEQMVLDGLIGSELLAQKARTVAIEVPQAEVDQRIAQTRSGMGDDAFQQELRKRGLTSEGLETMIRQNLMVQKMISEQVISAVQVTDAEARSFYDQNQAQMQKPEDVEASHILIRSAAADAPEKKAEARRKIEEALKRAKSGEPFEALAKEYSEDGSASRGGALGAVQRGQTVPAFEQVAFNLGVGQVSEVVESPFGYHIIKVTGKHPAGTASFEEARERIIDFLKQQKTREVLDKMVAELRAQAKIEML